VPSVMVVIGTGGVAGFFIVSLPLFTLSTWDSGRVHVGAGRLSVIRLLSVGCVERGREGTCYRSRYRVAGGVGVDAVQ